jgi:hypothetical protein
MYELKSHVEKYPTGNVTLQVLFEKSPAGDKTLVCTKSGRVIHQAAGEPVHVTAEGLKEGERFATPEDVMAAFELAKANNPNDETPPPEIKGWKPAKSEKKSPPLV